MRLGKPLALAAVATVASVSIWYAGRFTPSPRDDCNTQLDLVHFEDVAARAGVSFRHFDPATPQHLMPETMGSGLAWIDYDADGWPDLFCVQCGPIKPAQDVANLPTHKLYRNNRDGSFTDVTDAVGLNKTGFGVGVAVGDYDNDGFDDIVVTYLGKIGLYHNEADGKGGRRFADVTESSRLANPHYGTSCAWGDIDGDGFLDLYVCNYVEIDPDKPIICKHEKGIVFQCSPTAFPLTAHRLFRNNRDGTFTDITQSSGVADAARAPGLAVVVLDLDGDGQQDIYVANDMHPAYLFHNTGGGKFVEQALPCGVGLGSSGATLAGMCAEVADVEGSGRPSLFITNFQGSPNTLFLNRGNLRFADGTHSCGVGPPSLSRLGFGAAFLDANLDGELDLAVANGHVQRAARELYGSPYAQEAQFFIGDGRGRFREASATAGVDFLKPRVGRGLARCDFDNDGRPDLALSAVGEALALFRNATTTPNRWINLELIGDGQSSNRNAIGAVVRVEWAGQVRTHFITGGGSYLSAHDRRLALGLGPDATQLDRVVVKWPSGQTQEFHNLQAGTFWKLHEGQPEAKRSPPSRDS